MKACRCHAASATVCRFRLRTLFVLLTLACLWLGWNVRVVNQRREMLKDVESRGGRVIAGSTLINGAPPAAQGGSAGVWSSSISSLTILPMDGRVSWPRKLLGDHTIAVMYLPSSEFYADDAERIQEVFPETLLLPGPFGMQVSGSIYTRLQ